MTNLVDNHVASSHSHAAEVTSLNRQSKKEQNKIVHELIQLRDTLKETRDELKKGVNTETEGANEQPEVGSANSDSFFQLSAGPTALAQQIILEVMALYSEIIKLNQEQKVFSVNMQAKEAIAAAEATSAGAKAFGDAQIASGISMLAGSALSLGLTIGGTVYGLKEAKVKQTSLTKEMEPMKQIDKLTQETDSEALVAGPSGHVTPPTDKVGELANEFRNGNFENVNKPKAKEAIARLKALSEAREKGTLAPGSGYDSFDFDEWKVANNRKLNTLSAEHNSVSQEIANKAQTFNIYSQAASGAGQSVGNIVQGIGTTAKGQEDAVASLSNNASQILTSTGQEYGSGMSKATDAQNAEEQVLERLRQANSVA